MKKNDQKEIKNIFFKSVILSKTFKIIIFSLFIFLGLFFSTLFLKIIYFISIKDLKMVDEISEILYKFGTPYVLALIYFINFGSKNKQK